MQVANEGNLWWNDFHPPQGEGNSSLWIGGSIRWLWANLFPSVLFSQHDQRRPDFSLQGSVSVKKKTDSSDSDITFEEALQDLERTVRGLEQGNLSLDKTLEEYERAVGRVRFCLEQVQAAERKIEILKGIDASGAIRTERFNEFPEDLTEKQESRAKRRTNG